MLGPPLMGNRHTGKKKKKKKKKKIKKETTIECDSSEHGLGAVITQEGKPVAYASRTLTSTERNYAQIEKEALAIVFACERFEQYT